jgi:hypothetical protein
MIDKFRLSRVSSVLLLLVAGAGTAGCQRKPSPPSSPPANPSAPAATNPYSTSFSATGWTFQLRPLKPDERADEDKAKEIWRGLFPGMAQDVKTRDLIRHLHADLPAELVVLDAKQAEDKAALTAPPPDGFAIAMRVADISHKEVTSRVGTVPVRVIAYGRASRFKGLANPDSLGAMAENMRREPSPGTALDLAMEDYLLRHAPGWAVVGGPIIDEDVKLPASVEEQRRDLERRVEEYADQARAFYGARRER